LDRNAFFANTRIRSPWESLWMPEQGVEGKVIHNRYGLGPSGMGLAKSMVTPLCVVGHEIQNMLAQFIHSIAGSRPLWISLGRGKFLQWAQGIDTPKHRTQSRELPLPGESTHRRLQELESRMTDSFIVEAGLACIVTIGFLMGRQPGTFWPNPVWLG